MLAQAHGCPGKVREAAPWWYSTWTPVAARQHHMTPATRPSLAAATEWLQETLSVRDHHRGAHRAGYRFAGTQW